MLVGCKKGRSVKALRERVEILQGHDDTAHLGRQLAQYLEHVYIAQRWRGGKLLLTETDEKIKSDWLMLQSEGCRLNAVVCQFIVERKQKMLWGQQSFAASLEVIWPFVASADTANAEFDPEKPLLREVPRVPRWILSAFQDCFWSKQVANLIYVGEGGVRQLQSVCICFAEKLQAGDLINMSPMLS